jgi:hypothetical protein
MNLSTPFKPVPPATPNIESLVKSPVPTSNDFGVNRRNGLHFSHYKAAATNDALSEIHALFTELAITGESPFSRWESGLSCMLEKTAGVIKVDKLRAILLMEADFNFFTGLMFASRMMHQAEQFGRIPLECYGSRKTHEAIKVAINWHLIADILRQNISPALLLLWMPRTVMTISPTWLASSAPRVLTSTPVQSSPCS